MLKQMLIISLITLGPVACVDDAPVDDVVKADKNGEEAETKDFKVDKEGVITFKAEIVYFNFDDYSLTEDGKQALNAIADHLNGFPKKSLQIQGHCDERGSVEYNLALGTLRSAAVKKYLANAGISDERLATISYGEEQPAALGHSEDSFSKNRRADFVLTSN